jgi:hypothetical protein
MQDNLVKFSHKDCKWVCFERPNANLIRLGAINRLRDST